MGPLAMITPRMGQGSHLIPRHVSCEGGERFVGALERTTLRSTSSFRTSLSLHYALITTIMSTCQARLQPCSSDMFNAVTYVPPPPPFCISNYHGNMPPLNVTLETLGDSKGNYPIVLYPRCGPRIALPMNNMQQGLFTELP